MGLLNVVGCQGWMGATQEGPGAGAVEVEAGTAGDDVGVGNTGGADDTREAEEKGGALEEDAAGVHEASPVDEMELLAFDYAPPRPEIVGACDRDAGGAMVVATPGLRKLSKVELLASLRATLVPFCPGLGLQQLVPDKSLSHLAYDDRDPLQVAINSYAPDVSAVPGEVFVESFSTGQLRAWSGMSHLVASAFAGASCTETAFDAEACALGDRAELPAAPADCYGAIIGALGRRAFRRPLQQEEVARLTERALAEESARDAFYLIASHLLLSPFFMHLVELGEVSTDANDTTAGPDEAAAPVRLTQYEVAARLSYGLTGGPPDDELAAAADAGLLLGPSALRVHARRLVRSAAATDWLMRFFDQWLGLSNSAPPSVAWANYLQVPGDLDAAYLAEDMRREAKRFVRAVVFEQEGSYYDLLTRREAFVDNERLRMVYGTAAVPEDGANVPSDAPDHPGVLTRAALLASPGRETNPITRGAQVKLKALCQFIPMPDFTVVAARQEHASEFDPLLLPNHAVVAGLTGAGECQACHASINPVGFLFESYDPLGRYRTAQPVLRRATTAEWPAGSPLPELPEGVLYAPAVEHPLPGPQEFAIDGLFFESFESAEQLVEGIADSERGRACLAVRLFRYVSRRSETEADACVVADGLEVLRAEGPLLDALVELVAGERSFWRSP